LIDDIAGGFTFTGRGQPQAFQVLPLVVYKVFADGRPDELVRGVDIVGTPLAALTKNRRTGDTAKFSTVTAERIRFRAGFRGVSCDPDFRARSAEKGKAPRTVRDFARARARRGGCEDRRATMKTTPLFYSLFLLVAAIVCGGTASSVVAQQTQDPKDNDQTLRAMRDEMARAKTRLELKIPGTDQPVRPYYLEYRLLDLDFREISGELARC